MTYKITFFDTTGSDLYPVIEEIEAGEIKCYGDVKLLYERAHEFVDEYFTLRKRGSFSQLTVWRKNVFSCWIPVKRARNDD